jgi:hypothetical protein
LEKIVDASIYIGIVFYGAIIAIFLVTAAYCIGATAERKKCFPRLDAEFRYQQACKDVMTWLREDEFRGARMAASHIYHLGEGFVPVNSGMPHGDEVCTIPGLREQLRRHNRE